MDEGLLKILGPTQQCGPDKKVIVTTLNLEDIVPERDRSSWPKFEKWYVPFMDIVI